MARSTTLVILLLINAVITACKPEVRAAALHMGDSLMHQANEAIQTAEISNDNAVLGVFNSMVGVGLKDNNYFIPRVTSIQQRLNLDVVFISLGANDIHVSEESFPGETVIAEQIDSLLASFPAETIVYWILPHSNIGKLWSTGSQYEIVMQAIIDARDSGNWPNLKILDFDAWVESQNRDIGAMLDSDGIHLSKTGATYWASMIQNAIDTDFPI